VTDEDGTEEVKTDSDMDKSSANLNNLGLEKHDSAHSSKYIASSSKGMGEEEIYFQCPLYINF